jgi:cytidine deaminase
MDGNNLPSPPAALAAAARAAASGSYSPYSRFVVAAAIETEAGIFTGANVENASYGLSNCAERSAIFKAVNAGARKVTACVVYTPGEVLASPCGACRQVLREFAPEAGAGLRVWSVNDGARWRSWTLAELLPESFGPEDLGK